MATLELKVGKFSATKTASDINATRIFQSLLKRHGVDIDGMSGNEQAQNVMSIITDFIVNSATAQDVDDAAIIARDSVLNTPPVFVI